MIGVSIKILCFLLPGIGLLSCTERIAPVKEAHEPVAIRNTLSDSEMVASMNSFFSNLFGMMPGEIAAVEPQKALAETRTFRVALGEEKRVAFVSIDSASGAVRRYSDTSVWRQDRDGIVREFFPEKYTEYLEYRKKSEAEEEAERTRIAAVNQEAGGQKGAVKKASPWSCFGQPEEKQIRKENARIKEAVGKQIRQPQDVEWRERREAFERVASEWDKLLEWKPEYAKFSKEAAFEKIKPVLEHLGQPLDITSYYFGDESAYGPEHWHILINLEYQGVPFLGKRLHVEVSRYSGRVASLKYDPITKVPKRVTSPISKADAWKIAGKSIRKNSAFKWTLFRRAQEYEVNYKVNMGNITQYIALPEASPSVSRKERAIIRKMSPTQPRYCWEVPFTYKMIRSNGQYIPEKKRSNTLFVMYVDMETGNVIQSGPRVPRPPNP